jgi:hypothetical protein
MNCETCTITIDNLNTVEHCACCINSPGHHKYSGKVCPECGTEFCYSCCAGTNVDQGGKHDPDFMLCPNCGHDYYSQG